MKQFIKDIKKYAFFSIYAAKTDIKAEVADSYLNWIWWILEPICNMLVYYFVFGSIMKNTTEYFLIFIYSALLMWGFFSKSVLYSIKAIRMNRDIVTKVYIPKYVLLISNMMLNGIKLLISLVILAIMMIGFKVPVSSNILYVLPIYVVMILFTFGCGTIFMHFGVFIDDLAYAVSILMNMLFYLSGIFYDVGTAITAPLGAILAVYNPIAFFINSMRNALLYQMSPDLTILTVWLLISLILCGIGVRMVYKYENSYVKVV